MPTCFSALMCHAPIVIPEVAGGDAPLCTATTTAMREVARRAVASRPDRLVLISPHSPRRRHGWGAWAGRHRGDLRQFRAPQLQIELPDSPEVAAAITAEPVGGTPLDHGAMVPLHFLWQAGWRGPTAILALPWDGEGGEAVGRALAALPGRTAVIASGDMSHRLKPGAPSGYHPRAAEFDRNFVAGLRAMRWDEALAAEPRELAAEDVVASTRVALAATDGPRNAAVLSYEGPWGVGYTEAIFYEEEPVVSQNLSLPRLARQAIEAHLAGRPFVPPLGGPGPAGVFVTLHRDGELRGCIGHIEPVYRRLYEEIASVAPLSATEDPRFPPVSAAELGRFDIEVSVLEPPEPATEEQLDPRTWGVVLSSGRRRGILLPDLDGVDTVAQQLSITRRKAGIRPDEPVRIERFRVRKEAEAQPGADEEVS